MGSLILWFPRGSASGSHQQEIGGQKRKKPDPSPLGHVSASVLPNSPFPPAPALSLLPATPFPPTPSLPGLEVVLVFLCC